MSARVLVVDDLLPNVKLLAAKLSSEYFDVVTAQSGQAALDQLAKSSPDIVLLDVMMPGMDGFEVCERIKSDPATQHIPVVMVTALSDAENRVKGLEAGADDFLTKPVNDIALFARVRSLVRLKLTIDQWRMREHTSNQFGLRQGYSLRSEPADDARILVVEDNEIDADRIEGTLARDNNQVELAGGCAAAFERSLSGDHDLILVSLTLADEDGLRLCSQLRSHDRTRQIPLLLVGEDVEMKRIAKGLELGANDYILRPIDRNELRARARSQIRQKRYQDRLLSNYEASLNLALTDQLTGLYNRRYAMVHLERLLERVRETQRPFAVLMFDIDHFKRVNDSYGHAAGDSVLKEFAQRILHNMRNFDLVARVGGEEFVAILPETGLDTALTVAERLRTVVADEPFRIQGGDRMTELLRVTTSIGVTLAEPDAETVDTVLGRADRALYAAKHDGRNQVATELAGDQKRRAAAAGGWDVKMGNVATG